MKKFFLALALCLACTSPTSVPDEFSILRPPLVYRDWYSQVEQCSGRTGDFDRIRWYIVPGAKWYGERHQQNINGLWTDGHRIFIAEFEIFNVYLVKHEMLHDLGFEHEDVEVLTRCAKP